MVGRDKLHCMVNLRKVCVGSSVLSRLLDTISPILLLRIDYGYDDIFILSI